MSNGNSPTTASTPTTMRKSSSSTIADQMDNSWCYPQVANQPNEDSITPSVNSNNRETGEESTSKSISHQVDKSYQNITNHSPIEKPANLLQSIPTSINQCNVNTSSCNSSIERTGKRKQETILKSISPHTSPFPTPKRMRKG